MATKTLKLAFDKATATTENAEITAFKLDEIQAMGITPKSKVLTTKLGNPFIVLERGEDKEYCFLTAKFRIELMTKLNIEHTVETADVPRLDAKGKPVKVNGKVVTDTRTKGVTVDDVVEARTKFAAADLKLKGSEVMFYLNEGKDGEYLTVGRPANGELEDME